MAESLRPSDQADSRPRKTRATVWLLWPGLVLIGLAAGCFVAGVVLMWLTLDGLSSATTQPEASQAASGIALAMVPFSVMWPVGILGLVLTVAGLLIRRPQ